MNMKKAELCFVGMAIGDQPEHDVTEGDLRELYETVIRAALRQARPTLEVKRSDEVANPGVITTDILTHLMRSEYAVFDVTYPNPNVFYELGIRHSCGLPTIIVRDADAETPAPFDVRQQRHIPYENTKRGIQNLADELEERFAWYDENPQKADNPVLKHAGLLGFQFPRFEEEVREEQSEDMAELFLTLLSNEKVRQSLLDQMPEEQRGMFEAFFGGGTDDNIRKVITLLVKLGVFDPQDLLDQA